METVGRKIDLIRNCFAESITYHFLIILNFILIFFIKIKIFGNQCLALKIILFSKIQTQVRISVGVPFDISIHRDFVEHLIAIEEIFFRNKFLFSKFSERVNKSLPEFQRAFAIGWR